MTKDAIVSSIGQKKPIIALDCDGVLLDDHETFAQVYEKAFGKQVSVVSPTAFRAADMYGVKFTTEEEKYFYAVWDVEAWRTMPVVDGSLEACHRLHQAGYELVCVTSMAPQFTNDRLENLRSHGFPIDRVISTGYDGENPSNNPKRKVIEELHPIVFVDDSKRNFKDIRNVHTRFVFIDKYHNDPYRDVNIYYDVKYPNLLAFVHDFLKTEHGQEIIWPERPAFLLSSN